MIDQYYKNFKIRDYMGIEEVSEDLYKNFIDCSLGTNPFIEDNIIEKYIQMASYEINKYPINGYRRLKKELLTFWNKNFDNINEKNISFGSGTMGILRNISDFLIEKNTFVLGYSPQFPRFISEVELKKAVYEYYSLDKMKNYKFITEDFIKMINNKYSVIYIDNPNNPTGQIIDVNDIENIVKTAKKYNITVIIDEAYGDYMSFQNSSIALINKYNNVVVLRSASKFFGLPNHRVGYIFAAEEFIKIYDMVTIPFPFSDLSANIFVNMLQNYDEFKGIQQKVIEANKKLYQAINKDNYLYTNVGTPIFTIKSDKYDNLTKKLMEKEVVSESCNKFINLDDNHTRIRIKQDYDKLIRILNEIL